ncbi:Protein-export membrane protein SecD [Liberibacter crescens BT-1]|uniref:Multifunctional fusion protein n=1 Tax=Liberibacter crescens (strain BT-1) TaxID=1215343 RepID=L0EVK8_LIBCB|nr:protein translocase subunit SecD [Liberibacter crescens]AGA64987.1 Protein-export membrane protein SecD [Liberibacter crescens BT-1]
MRTSPWLVGFYISIIFIGILIALPNILPLSVVNQMPFFMPKKRISLGLDLSGGSYLVLEVDEADLIHEQLQTLLNEIRFILKKKNIPTVSVSQSDKKIIVVLQNPDNRQEVFEQLKSFSQPIDFDVISSPKDSLKIEETSEKIITVSFSQSSISNKVKSAVEQSIEIIRQRIDQIGVAEPTIQRLGLNRILVQLPGEQDPSRLRKLLGTTAKMSFHMVSKSLPDQKPLPFGVSLLKDDNGQSYAIEDRIEISGERLSSASASFDPQTHKPVIDIMFDSIGANRFAEITRDNIGRPFAVVMDNKILTAPVINQAIPNGRAQISGNFTVESASTLAAMLRAGALPAKLTVIEERSVGADLGADAIRKGVYTGCIGFVLIVLFIVILYGSWGLLANVALFINVILTFACLTLMGATLTLPGIAGIVLGIGLAVDANVLINERIREEVKKGRSAFASIDFGFSHAYSTIVDSNVTALIATVILFFYGSGPVRGFSVTMALAIIISMFTAVSVVRVMMIAIVRYTKMKIINIKPLFVRNFVPENMNIQFMKARFIGIGISSVISIFSIILFFTSGLNYGVDFRGGIQMEVSTEKSLDLSTFRSGLDSLKIGKVGLQAFEDDKHFLLRVEHQPGNNDAQSDTVKLIKVKLMEIDPLAHVQRVEIVGPKVSNELVNSGIISVVLSAIAMMVYIWIRFEFHFAIGAIITLILDITKTLGFFSLTGIEFNLTAIAAVLTLIGYSVNDKVVVYDRMRENMRFYKNLSLREIIDKSINETLGRSIYTSATAFLAMLPMAIWGGSAVSSFSIPMVFGICVAAISSIFIAAPILLFLGDWRNRHNNLVQNSVSDTVAHK